MQSQHNYTVFLCNLMHFFYSVTICKAALQIPLTQDNSHSNSLYRNEITIIKLLNNGTTFYNAFPKS